MGWEEAKEASDHAGDPCILGLRMGSRTFKDHSSAKARLSGLLAGLKDYGKVPKADGEIAVRATPEPPRLPAKGRRRGRQCQRRDSGPVVLDGVTSVQGVRESRMQGEGA